MLGKKNPNAGRKGKPFTIIETGEIYNTIASCAKAINGSETRIWECLHGRQSTYKNYHFQYL